MQRLPFLLCRMFWASLLGLSLAGFSAGAAAITFTVPSEDADGEITLSWGYSTTGYSGYITIHERIGSNGSWRSIFGATNIAGSHAISREPGTYQYYLRECVFIGTPNGAVQNCEDTAAYTVTVNQPTPVLPPPPPVDNSVSGTSTSALPAIASNPVTPSQQQALDEQLPTTGAFAVSESGAATYSIPIKVASGTAGVTPDIYLNYSSQGGNGLVGIGWSIAGLSEIARCRPTLAQDKRAQQLTWGAGDRFCLDGQRLVLEDPATTEYGSVGAVYRTEIDTGAVVESIGGSAGRPDYFRVTRRDGSISQYGGGGSHNSEERGYNIRREPNVNVLRWALSEMADSVGNKIEYSYTNTLDAFRIRMITYAGSDAQIEFEYDERPDVLSSYVIGYEFRNSGRLTKISTRSRPPGAPVSPELVRLYELEYESSTPSRLVSVVECTDVGTCLEPLTLTWGRAQVDAAASFSHPTRNSATVLMRTLMDVDGNGIQDPIWIERQGEQSAIKYRAIEGGESVVKSLYSYRYSGSRHVEIRVLDYNLDGRDDVIVFNPNVSSDRWQLFLSQPVSAQGEMIWKLVRWEQDVLPFANSDKAIQFHDVNSDGILDAYYVDPSNTRLVIYRGRRSGQPVDAPNYYQFSNIAEYVALNTTRERLEAGMYGWGDFNGDGNTDFAYFTHGNPDPSAETPARLLIVTPLPDDSFTTWAPSYAAYGELADFITADINGDGLTDIATQQAVGVWTVGINNGSDFYSRSLDRDSAASSARYTEEHGFFDFNQDGFLDFYWRDGNRYYYQQWEPAQRTFGSNQLAPVALSNSADSVSFVDMDGSGSPAQLRSERDGGSGGWTVELKPMGRDVPRLLTAMTTSLGATTLVTYKPLVRGATSDHYETVGGIKGVEGERCSGGYETEGGYVPVSCSSVINYDTGDFYRLINDPFGTYSPGAQRVRSNLAVPVLELKGGAPVVVQVDSSAPTGEKQSAEASIRYSYGVGRYQGGGRGFLGFSKLTTEDLQTGVRTSTQYRQDWPFTGRPIATRSTSRSGHLLSESANDYRIAGRESISASAVDQYGSAYLGALGIYTAKSQTRTYQLKDNGSQQGELLSIEATDLQVDDFGNILQTITTIRSGSTSAATETITTNSYYGDEWSLKRGRLSETKVQVKRTDEHGIVSLAPERTTKFTYYPGSGSLAGLLQKEVVNPDLPGAESYSKEYFYDVFGNLQYTYTVGADGVRRLSEAKIYEPTGRFVKQVYGLVADGGASDAGAPEGYVSRLQESDSSGQFTSRLLSEITSFDRLGNPLRIEEMIGGNRTNTTVFAYSPGGQLVYTASSLGQLEYTLAIDTSSGRCPLGTTTGIRKVKHDGAESFECLDLLGRPLRRATLGFSGEQISTDYRYDVRGNLIGVSDPSAEIPSDWNTFGYDLRGRKILSQASNGAQTTEEYTTGADGFAQAVLAGELSRTSQTTHDEMGRVTKSSDAAHDGVKFNFDPRGKLKEVIFPKTSSASGVKATLTYDAQGRKTSIFDPNMGLWRYSYNSFGDLICQQTATGETVIYTYDLLGRQITRILRNNDSKDNSCSDQTGTITSATHWTYDTALYGWGKLSDVQTVESGVAGRDSEHQVTYYYDEYGRNSRQAVYITGPDSYNNHYSSVVYDQYSRPWKIYDAARNSASFDSNGIEQRYNAFGYLFAIADAQNSNYLYQRVLTVDPRGKATTIDLANGVINVGAAYDSNTGLAESIVARNGTGERLLDHRYEWDLQGNLIERRDTGLKVGGGYRSIVEGFSYDYSNRLESVTSTARSKIDITYDAAGNIKSKSDIGDYEYGSKIHAVTKAGATSYTYNANGSVVSDSSGRTFSYTPDNKIGAISSGGLTSNFWYGPDGQRYKRVDRSPTGTITTLYLTGVEKIYHADGSKEWRRYIGNLIVTQKFNNAWTQTSSATTILLKDHIGSVSAIADANGILQDVLSFDAWGQRRNAETEIILTGSAFAPFLLTNRPVTQRGFTGHEMLDEHKIIHMNGRIYDAAIGRFLQADPIVQDAGEPISYNRYAYVWNNPLSASDPSGYISLKQFAGLALGAAVAAFCQACTANLWAAALTGAAMGGVNAALNGGNILRGMAMGAISGAAFYGVGSAFQACTACQAGTEGVFGTELTATAFAGKVFAHAMVGGTMGVLQGGKFGHGFAAAGVVQAFSGKIDSIGGNDESAGYLDAGNRIMRIAAAAAVGGTTSSITGDKFANGAMTGAFSRLFNDEAHAEVSVWERIKGRLSSYFVRPGEATAIGFGADFVIGTKGISFGAGYVAFDMDGDFAIDKRAFYWYSSEKVLGLDYGIQMEYLASPNPEMFFGKSAEVGATFKGIDFSVANANPSSSITSPADHVYAIGAGWGRGAHWAEINTVPIVSW